MRERLLSRGASALADYEILEMLLFWGIPRRDTKPLAKDLINRFGGLAAVLSADPEILAVRGRLGPDAVAVLGMPREAVSRLSLAEDRARPVLNNWDRLLAYFDTALQGAVPGQLRMLLLDNRNRLLSDEPLLGEPEELSHVLAARALFLHATALVLVRVLPPGPVDKALPKKEAVLATALGRAIAPLNIVLHDHMLVGGANWISLRQKSLL